MSWLHGYLRCMLFFRCDVLLLKFLCMSIEIYWRRDVYFLNNCYIRVLYCFNRSRVLHILSLSPNVAREVTGRGWRKVEFVRVNSPLPLVVTSSSTSIPIYHLALVLIIHFFWGACGMDARFPSPEALPRLRHDQTGQGEWLSSYAPLYFTYYAIRSLLRIGVHALLILKVGWQTISCGVHSKRFPL